MQRYHYTTMILPIIALVMGIGLALSPVAFREIYSKIRCTPDQNILATWTSIEQGSCKPQYKLVKYQPHY